MWPRAVAGAAALALVACACDESAPSRPPSPSRDASAESSGGDADAESASTDARADALTDAPADLAPDAAAADLAPDVARADAARADAAGTDAPSSSSSSDAAPRACPGLFCEDFERGRLDEAVWTVKTYGGQTVTVQSAVAAHGAYAARFHANPNVVSYDFIITKAAPAGLRGHHFGRAYFMVTPAPPAAHIAYLFAGSSGFPMLRYLEVAGVSTRWQLSFVNLVPAAGSAQSGPGTGEVYSAGGAIPLAQWLCLEWEMNDAPDQVTVFVNGRQEHSFPSITFGGASTGLVGATGFTDFGFGYYAWHPSATPFDVYYDDIVLGAERVGCLP